MCDPNIDKRIEELTVSKLFSEDVQYVIPLYQRAFAWGEKTKETEEKGKEIAQLIDDINDFDRKQHYYIGSLIVSKIGKKQYEVIDGQQRLTALFLLVSALHYAEIEINGNILTFECREKSNKTLKEIKNWDSLSDDDKNTKKLDVEDGETSLLSGKEIIDETIKGENFNKNHFLQQLKKVKLYRIEVPPRTDLNRYFEIMNTRGEQLEQHDVLKATLMSFLDCNKEKSQFAKIWEACSDMTGYVQMHFDTNDRRALFGNHWDVEPQVSNLGSSEDSSVAPNSLNIKDIITKPDFEVDKTDGVTDKDERIRFESIISFPYFLLHTLKVLVADKNISHKTEDETETLVYESEMLDDKKLTDTFNRVINDGMIGGVKISKKTFSLYFIKCLLKTRWLFDKYIIKREYLVNKNTDGRWSLQRLKVDDKKNNKATYVYTFGETKNNTNLMLQSCLRVTYTSPKVMHWITTLLKWLYLNNRENLQKLNEYEREIENIAATDVWNDYLKGGEYNKGTDTPHIVFNYLDYLLWVDSQKKKKYGVYGDFGDFKFEFRKSVEHWYPQHPDPPHEQWTHDKGLDDFGNLCIVHRSTNSKLSNLPPDAKRNAYDATIEKESLKLRIMAGIMEKQNVKPKDWINPACEKHQVAMINELKKACERAGYQVDEVDEDGVV